MGTKTSILQKDFYTRNTIKVARELLGKLLIRKIGSRYMSGKIVETEAYRGFDDTACHGSKGKSKKCKAMFADSGKIYVYLVYGIHFMLNIVTEKKDFPSAVLIRAIKPMSGVDEMYKNRGVGSLIDLTNGPGKLTQALQIDKSLNGERLVKSSGLWIEKPKLHERSFDIAKSSRVGIDYAGRKSRQVKWRFFLKSSKFVSKV